MTDTALLAACERLLKIRVEVLEMDARSRDWFLSKPGHTDAFDVAHALLSILATGIQRKGPQMSDTADSRPDPVAQIELWLKQYLEHMKCPQIAAQVNHGLVFRITRTMIEQGKSLDDVQVIIVEMAKAKTRPRSIGYLITVIEGNLGRVA